MSGSTDPVTGILAARALTLPEPSDAGEGMSELDSLQALIFAMCCSRPGGYAGPPRDEAVENGETAVGTGVSSSSSASSCGALMSGVVSVSGDAMPRERLGVVWTGDGAIGCSICT